MRSSSRSRCTVFSRQSHVLVLVHVVVFCAVRIATWIIRAVQSGGTSYSTGLFIAELIMLSLGAVLLVEPLLTLVTIHVTSESYTEGRRVDFTRVLRLLRLASSSRSSSASTRAAG